MTSKLAVKIITAFFLAGILPGCSSDSPEQKETATEAPGLVDLESYLTNIGDTGGDRYCKLTVKLVVSPKGVASEISEDTLLKARIHDEVLKLLTAKTFAELNDPSGREAFREELRARLAALLTKGEIQQVLFAEFIVQ
jgi:flagellar basal body-associated protein FliL